MTEVDNEEWDFTPWTPEGAARLRAAAEALATAVRAHAESVIAAADQRDAPQVFAANDVVEPAVLEYAEAQFDFTGIGSPVGYLDDSEEDHDGDDDAVRAEPKAGITVLQRRDYAVTDEAAVLAAGRAAYLKVWPDDDEAAAAADVTHLGRALYQAAHAGEGFADLDEMPGLVPTGGAVVVVRQDELLTGLPDDWPHDLFGVDGEQLYEMQDVYVD
jgi:hypothetical protein